MACERNCKIQQENSCFYFLRCLPCKLTKTIVKIIQVSCFRNYGFSSEVPQEGEQDDLWIFRYLTCSRLVLSLPFIGSFAARYFLHLFDLSRFATTLFFAVVRQLTINYSLTTGIHQSLLICPVIRTFNIDFNWFLTCSDINSFKHFILLFYYMYFKQYMCRTGFKNGGLRERPLTENGGVSERPLTGKNRILEIK